MRRSSDAKLPPFNKGNDILRFMSFLPFFLIPFLGGNHLSFYYFTIEKFWIDSTFLVLLIISILYNFYIKKRFTVAFLYFLLPFLLFFLITLLSYLYSWIRLNTLVEVNHLLWAIGGVYLFSLIDDKEKPLKALIWGTTVVVLSMAVQYEVLYPSLQEMYKEGHYGDLVRSKVVPTASFLNEATLGGYLLFSLPLGIFFSVFKKEKIYFLPSSLILFGILFSLSRMAFLIAFVSILFMALLVVKRTGIKRLSGLFYIIIIATAIFFFLNYTTDEKKADERPILERGLYKLESIPKHITTLTYRTNTWEKAINAFIDSPLKGYGAGTFEYVFKKYYDATLYTKYSHSIIIKVLVELGILGLFSFLLYPFSLFLCFFIKLYLYHPVGIPVGKDDRDLYIFMAISAFSGLVFAFFNVAFESPAYTITFFVLSSFLPMALMETKEGANLLSLPLLISVLFALVCSLFFTVKTDTAWKLNEQGMIFEELGMLDEALNSYSEAITIMPSNSFGYIGRIGILLKLYNATDDKDIREKIRRALNDTVEKIEKNPDRNGELFFVKGKIYEIMGNKDKEEKNLYTALYYHPSSGFYMYEIGKYHFRYGEFEKLKGIIELMKIYEPRHKGSDMHGIYVYKMRDLEASMEFIEGRKESAYALALKNLEEAEADNSSFANVLSREYVQKEKVIEYLKSRVLYFKSRID
ncbi:MAG: O-antigen ligase family protein [Syntrophorhabdaceae bacterium]|nr:O-antigen ligase family protein [Syntrophorhabdaceae bacterium]